MNSGVHPTEEIKYRVANWASYERALVGRGDVTRWVSSDAIATWEESAHDMANDSQSPCRSS